MDKSLIFLFIIAFLFSWVTIYVLIPKLKQLGAVQFERDETLEKHKKKEGTPRGGGIVFLITPLLLLFFFRNREFLFLYSFVFVFGTIGLIDDLLTILKKDSEGLTIRWKLLLFILFSIIIYYIFKDVIKPELVIFGKKFFLGTPLYFLLYFIIIVGSPNAFNLTDGVDGLLGTVTIPILVTVMIIGGSLIRSFSFLILASVLAFLWFNSPKATIFMGDVGSSSLGAILGAMAILGHFEIPFAFMAIIPLIEAFSVFIQVSYFKISHGKRVFKMAPIHHHFEILGWSEPKIVFRFTIITVIFCLLAIVFH